MFIFCGHAETHPMTSRCFGTKRELSLCARTSTTHESWRPGRTLSFARSPPNCVAANMGHRDHALRRDTHVGRLYRNCADLHRRSVNAPAQSQPSGSGSAGLLSPVPMTGSSPEHRFVPPTARSGLPLHLKRLSRMRLRYYRRRQLRPLRAAASTPGPLWTRRDIAPAATRTTPKQPPRHRRTASAPKPRREAMKQASIQKQKGTQRSQVRPNRLGTKLMPVRQEAKSRGQASTWAATDRRGTRRAATARIELAPRGEPQLPLGLMPRHARRE